MNDALGVHRHQHRAQLKRNLSTRVGRDRRVGLQRLEGLALQQLQGRPSPRVPTSKTRTTPGWLTARMVCPSATKRATASGSTTNAG
jgi:hypothetical protein